MTGQQLIDLIVRHDLQNHEFVATLLETDSTDYGVSLKRFDIENHIEIAHSDKVAVLSLVNDEE